MWRGAEGRQVEVVVFASFNCSEFHAVLNDLLTPNPLIPSLPLLLLVSVSTPVLI